MKNLQPILKYLIWPGLALVTAGLVIGILNGWTLVAVALLVIGLMLIVSSVAASDLRSWSGFWQRRSTQAGTNAAVSVVAVLVILGLVNFLGARYDSRTDLTEGQLLTLSPASQEVVENLEQPTEVLIFSPVPDPTDQQLLENYRRYNPDFTYRYVDPFAEPQLSQQLGVETGGEVFLRVESENADQPVRNLLVQQVSPQEPLAERQLTNKLAQLSQENMAVVYFLQGHEEYAIDGSQAGFAEAANRLRDENYTVAPLNLADTGGVPADADVLVIAGPQQKLFDQEVAAVQAYLETGGSVFVLIDPQVETGLEGLLSQWGIVAEDTLVIDTSGGGQLVGLGPAAPLVTDYGDHPITAAFGNGRSFFPVARPLQIKEVSNIEETPLLFTNENSHAQTITEGELSVDPNQAPAGPFALGVALARPAQVEGSAAPESAEPEAVEPEADAAAEPADTEPTDPEESRMVVIGNSSFATDGLFDQQLNGDVFLNSVSWLSKQDSLTLSIRPKEATNRRFNMTVTQQILLTLLALVVFPLLGLIGAGTLWARRR
ncbi:Gldg family protein [soil metagenome]|uniref:GldG family protein n=1 Tax=Leptolyngbya sp. BC1307 TaxID=2029589 RepID=UPI000EFB47B2|nr:Gldg family protein [Leptolyngbya sp. BC1307]